MTRNRLKTFKSIGILGLAFVSISLCSIIAFAQSDQIAAKIDEQWAIYCDKALSEQQSNTCFLGTFMRSKQDDSLWIKIALYFDDPTSLPRLIIKIPRLESFKLGIIFTGERKYNKKLEIESCNKDTCEASIQMDPEFFRVFSISKVFGLQYEIGSDEEIRFLVTSDRSFDAIKELRKINKFDDTNTPPNPVLVSLLSKEELFSKGLDLPEINRQLVRCIATTSKKPIKVSNDFEIENPKALSAWIEKNKYCVEHAGVVVKRSPPRGSVRSVAFAPVFSRIAVGRILESKLDNVAYTNENGAIEYARQRVTPAR